MPEKIAILVDSGCDVPPEVLAKYDNIAVAPMLIMMNGKAYRDNVDLTPEAFYSQLNVSEKLPTTSAPTQGSVEACVVDLTRILSAFRCRLNYRRRLKR